MSDRKKLRRLAEAATPGPWWADTGATIGDDSDEATHVWFRAARNDLYLAIGKVLDNDLDQTTFEDAEFIAAANPAAVLDLLDQLDAAEAKLAKANRSLIELKPDPVSHRQDREFIQACSPDVVLALLAERDALAAKVERVQALHFGEYVEGEDWNRCFECGDEWPCSTIRALDGEATA